MNSDETNSQTIFLGTSLENNRFVISVCRAGLYALLGPTNNLYLPVVRH